MFWWNSKVPVPSPQLTLEPSTTNGLELKKLLGFLQCSGAFRSTSENIWGNIQGRIKISSTTESHFLQDAWDCECPIIVQMIKSFYNLVRNVLGPKRWEVMPFSFSKTFISLFLFLEYCLPCQATRLMNDLVTKQNISTNQRFFNPYVVYWCSFFTNYFGFPSFKWDDGIPRQSTNKELDILCQTVYVRLLSMNRTESFLWS